MEGYDTHLVEVEGFNKRNGVSGGHNLEELNKYFKDNNWSYKEIGRTEHPNPGFKGIYDIEYQVQAKDYSGTPIKGQWAKGEFKKTVYDPSVISNEQIIKLGQDAMNEGINNGRIKLVSGNNLDKIQGIANNGLKFEGWRNPVTGEIKNFYPVLDWFK